jgi:hypothetical protein
MPLSQFEIARIQRLTDAFAATYSRPDLNITYDWEWVGAQSLIFRQHCIGFRQTAVVYPIAKLRYVKSARHWLLYWQRADGRWHLYEPDIYAQLEVALDAVRIDRDGCFFG